MRNALRERRKEKKKTKYNRKFTHLYDTRPFELSMKFGNKTKKKEQKQKPQNWRGNMCLQKAKKQNTKTKGGMQRMKKTEADSHGIWPEPIL